MSSDFINPIGANAPRLNRTQQVTPQRAVEAPTNAETGNQAPKVEGYQPTTESRETLSDQRAGEAKASEILGAWAPQVPQANPTANSGQLVVEGASNTSTNVVHGSANGAKPGFTEGTTYKSAPPNA